MNKTKLELELYNKDKKNVIKSNLSYGEINNKVYIQIDFLDTNIRLEGDNYFEVLNSIRNMIYPYIPLVYGCDIEYFPSSSSLQMSLGTVLYKEEFTLPAIESKFIFEKHIINENLTTPMYQIARHYIWFKTLGIEERYGIDKEYILIEKVSKFKYLPYKVLNENYQYFWIYDKKQNVVYDTKNLADIKRFKEGRLMYKWKSFNEFLEWYYLNYIKKV